MKKFLEKYFPKADKPPEIPRSPAQLQSKPINSSRRITKRPLVLAFCIAVAFLIMVTYTFYSRAQSTANATNELKKPKSEEASVPDWFSNHDESQKEGVVEPSTTQPSLENTNAQDNTSKGQIANVQSDTQSPSGNLQSNQPAQLSPYQQLRLQQWQQREQDKEQIVQARRTALQSALNSGTTIYTNTSNPQNGIATATGNQDTQHGKVTFPTSTPDTENYLPNTRVKPISPFEVKAGTVIPSVMIGGINSDLAGQIIAQVSQNVFDTGTGAHLLIPQGTRLVGTYDHQVQSGQNRVFVIWNRLIYPNASSLNIDGMAGADQGGYGGFSDKTNSHFWPTFRNAMMLSAITAGAQLSQPRPSNGDYGYSSQQILASSLGMQMNQLGMQMLGRTMNRQPTITIRPGYIFNVMVNKDIILPPWEGNS